MILHPQLQRVARHHSLDMAQRDYLDHCSPEGCDFDDRLEAAGLQGTFGENISLATANVADAVQRLMDSPGHCSNIMAAANRYVGIGHATSSSSSLVHYWTQDFADLLRPVIARP